MTIDPLDPSYRNEMMLAIRTVVLRELDCPTLDLIDHAHLLSAGRNDVHVVCNRTDATISSLTPDHSFRSSP